jgi:predicted GNAT family acetyltransferase
VVPPNYRLNEKDTALSQAVTGAVLTDGYELIVRNVRRDITVANKAYRRLGFEHIATYVEGFAERY